MKRRVLHILFWSVLSAAFIGPGTVTTAASAGAGFGYTLIWALIFSTAACFILQEASARITQVTGLSLGQTMQKLYSKSRAGNAFKWLVLVSIISGCAAFEAGNILGAVAGITLVLDDAYTPLIVLAIGFVAGALLWNGSVPQIATFLGIIVAIMGVCFVVTAISIPHKLMPIFSGAFKPQVPPGAEILVLGLIGTTVVPYNIFLGSGLKHTQTLSEMKLSLLIAIGLGGFVSVAILLTGTAIAGTFTFEALAAALTDQLGGWARWLLAIGLFGAGISSALTAALAAAITAGSLLGKPGTTHWTEKSVRFRSVWISVLLIGLIFGLKQLQPVPVIIIAQALNGIILPLIAVLLFLLMNNKKVLPPSAQNGKLYNLVMAGVVYLSVLIGLTNVFRAVSRVAGFELMNQNRIIYLSILMFAVLIIPVLKTIIFKNRTSV
ncbi:MAG: divalent metal cation transporter [Balneolaceae bacterium]|nr:divalent metal cation transporter [Balneolaceae bacterium]